MAEAQPVGEPFQPPKFVINQVVWARWERETWYPCMIVDRNNNVYGFALMNKPPTSNQRDVLWLGEGLTSRVNIGQIRDFCQSFQFCFNRMKSNATLVRTVEICVKLAAERCKHKLVNNQWVKWARDELKLNEFTLIISRCFYEALVEVPRKQRKKRAQRRSHLACTTFKSGTAGEEVVSVKTEQEDETTTEIGIEKSNCTKVMAHKTTTIVLEIPEASESVKCVERMQPCGWLAWYKSVKEGAFIPCIVLDIFRLPKNVKCPNEKLYVTTLLRDPQCDHVYRKFLVQKTMVIDFCSTFNSLYDAYNKKDSYKQAIITALKMVAEHGNVANVVDGAHFKSEHLLLQWAKNNIQALAPFILACEAVEKYFVNRPDYQEDKQVYALNGTKKRKVKHGA